MELLLLGLVLGIIIGKNWDNVSDGVRNAFDQIPDAESIQNGFATFFADKRRVVIVLVIVALVVVAAVFYVLQPNSQVSVGSVVELIDACESSHSVTITETHVEQGVVLVGKGNCQKSYPLVVPNP